MKCACKVRTRERGRLALNCSPTLEWLKKLQKTLQISSSETPGQHFRRDSESSGKNDGCRRTKASRMFNFLQSRSSARFYCRTPFSTLLFLRQQTFPRSRHVMFHWLCFSFSFLLLRRNQRLRRCDKRNGALTAQIAATLGTHSERHGAAEGGEGKREEWREGQPSENVCVSSARSA